jgi:LacI family transcriptional regulator
MAELAEEMGLSRMTVSAVVNDRAKRLGLAEDTVRRVREHLDRRGYVPSLYARNLREAPKRVVGILHVGHIYSHLIEAFHGLVEDLAGAAPGLEIMVTPRERLQASVRELLARRVTDLVWIHNGSACEEYRSEGLASYLSNTRTIIYDYPFNSPLGCDDLLSRGFGLVGVDRRKHIRRLARFLKGLGHQVVALPDVDTGEAANRWYLDVFVTAGLAVAEYSPPFRVGRLLETMKRHGVTAVCFHGDSPACRAICDMGAAGVRIPEDLTVTGFDGMSRSFNKDLTTLAMPVRDMITRVREIVTGGEQELRHCLDLELVKGRTHGPPPRRAAAV